MLVLFGGGDGGGFYVGPDGKFHKIPPYSPDVGAKLKATNHLLQATRLARLPHAELVGHAQNLFAAAAPEAAKGVIIVDGSPVVYLDVDGGFTCGSTGPHLHLKDPHPFPFPPGIGPGPKLGTAL
jgi:hypothetical protein